MHYHIKQLTRFTYSAPVHENVVEVRMQPLTMAHQQCLDFAVATAPRARVFRYRDHYGNAVHAFDVPERHTELDVTVDAVVAIAPRPPLPRRVGPEAWAAIDAFGTSGEYLDWLLPSRLTTSTPSLEQFALATGFGRSDDPLSVLRQLNSTVFAQFSYEPRTAGTDMTIDEVLRHRHGIARDLAHVMIAMVRGVGIPCRLVSGYVTPRASHLDRAGDNTMHAWLEALIPGLGWVGFDPTNNTVVSQRHIVVAVGRDYADVSPARDVHQGEADSTLSVAVSIAPVDEPLPVHELAPAFDWMAPARLAPVGFGQQ